jgi:hypothetical protein
MMHAIEFLAAIILLNIGIWALALLITVLWVG